MKKPDGREILSLLKNALKRGFSAWIFVVRLTVPALLLTRLLLYFDLIPYVAAVFKPLMALLGLPPEAALVWVTGMLSNLYVAIFVFIDLAPVMGPFTVVQATVMGALCLVAHALIVEGQACRGAGVSFWRVSVLRLISAFAFGWLIFKFSQLSGWGQGPSSVLSLLSTTGDPVPSWGLWVLKSAQQLAMILLIIESMMLLMEFFKLVGITGLIVKLLWLPLRLAGIGQQAAMVTIIGCVLGLGYGGGLIIAEKRSGSISQHDTYGAITLLALFHAMIEDTIIMWALGGSLWWLIGGRLIFALFITALLTRLALTKWGRPILVGRSWPDVKPLLVK